MVMQQFPEYPGPDACIAIMNEAHKLLRYSGIKSVKEAEKTLCCCQDQLRQHHIKFHLAPCGEWVLDKVPSTVLDRTAL
jgi:hypothetical protein